jgi:signal transduction histidine kinase
MGLSNIISRIRSLKGNYSLNSDASKGVEFKLVIPVAK